MPAQKHINSVLLQEDSVIQFFAEVCGAMGMSLPRASSFPKEKRRNWDWRKSEERKVESSM